MTSPLVPVFDLDGTLIDSDDALVKPFLDLGVPREEISFGHPIVEECQRLGIALDDYVGTYDTTAAQPFPGVAELVTGLDRWAICSNKDERSARAELERLGWRPEVAMFAGDFGGRPKSLGPVLAAIEVASDDVIFVGDTDHDRRSALDVGAHFAWALWNPRTAAAVDEGWGAPTPEALRDVLARSDGGRSILRGG